MNKLLRSHRSLALWILTLNVVLFTLPWRIARIITGSTWDNSEQFANTIQHGFLSDLIENIATPGYGDSSLAVANRFWFWFHLSKASIALSLLVLIFFQLRNVQEKNLLSFTKVRMTARMIEKIGLKSLALFIFLILAANIQGTIAPLSSLISFLPAHQQDTQFVESISGLRKALHSNETNSLASFILRDFSIYHLSIAVVFGLTSILLFKRIYSLARKRNFSSAFGLGLLGIGFFLLGIANLGTGIHPIPAFDAFLSGI